MPTLFIPNALDLYVKPIISLNKKDVIARIIYQWRFLWLLNPGDAIILPMKPSKDFLNYFAELKQINLDTIHIITWDTYNSSTHDALTDQNLINKLHEVITTSSTWSIYACYMNQSIINLADKLSISISTAQRMLAIHDDVRNMNGKSFFREIAKQCSLSIAEGITCSSLNVLTRAIHTLLPKQGQIIIKQNFNGGGKGNIIITTNSEKTFTGAIQTYFIDDMADIECISKSIWENYTDISQRQLIVEIYYDNLGSFTCMLWIPPVGQPQLLHASEIRMQTTWIGIQIPPQLSAEHQVQLTENSMRLAHLLQTHHYSGYLCCDAILAINHKLIFTEINVRAGAEINAQAIASHLYGLDFYRKTIILTRKGIKADTFDFIYQLLKENNLLLSAKNKIGVIILSLEETFNHELEYLIVAPDLDNAHALENQLLNLIQTKCTITT